MDHDLQAPFYDVAGQPMDAKAFRAKYPARLTIAMRRVFGFTVHTQFVGINHRHDTRLEPHIYETVLLYRGQIASSGWTCGYKRAKFVHWVSVLVCASGAAWLRLRGSK